jgi:hypothetical protein
MLPEPTVAHSRGHAVSVELSGRWRVERVSGLLPPIGVRKQIGRVRGTTWLGPVPVGAFRVEGRTLEYAGWPIRDELRPAAGGWIGRGLIFGRQFCVFRLVREPCETRPLPAPLGRRAL